MTHQNIDNILILIKKRRDYLEGNFLPVLSSVGSCEDAGRLFRLHPLLDWLPLGGV